MKFPSTYFAFQHMMIPNISYMFLVELEDSTKFHGNVWNM